MVFWGQISTKNIWKWGKQHGKEKSPEHSVFLSCVYPYQVQRAVRKLIFLLNFTKWERYLGNKQTATNSIVARQLWLPGGGPHHLWQIRNPSPRSSSFWQCQMSYFQQMVVSVFFIKFIMTMSRPIVAMCLMAEACMFSFQRGAF